MKLALVKFSFRGDQLTSFTLPNSLANDWRTWCGATWLEVVKACADKANTPTTAIQNKRFMCYGFWCEKLFVQQRCTTTKNYTSMQVRAVVIAGRMRRCSCEVMSGSLV